ncbi:hypothetical protein MPSEU_000785300 [Mayamaea pseudoterrestris]|nr:hypothetical protein MPSEU_000785300 [Mayamaea pseudoterrestris]
MTTVQKLQQRVENAATKMEGKLQEWSTRSSPAIDSLPKPTTISLQRTSAGTSTSSPSVASATKTLTKPVKITIPPLPATAAKPRTTMTAPATATSPTAPFSTALTAVAPATAAATSVAASPVKSTSAPTLTELPLAVASTMASVPLTTTPPSYKETPTKQPLQVIDQDKPTVKVAGSGDQLPPLSVMGFDANGRALTPEPKKNSKDRKETSTSISPRKGSTNSPKHDALRAIGFGNATPATEAKTSHQQPLVVKDTYQASRSSTSSSVSSAPFVKSGAATNGEWKERPIIVQPRPLDEEVALQQKYAAIDDVGERAYQILIDLSMI